MLTAPQLQTLKNAITTDQTMAGIADSVDLSTYLNQPASPTFLAWDTHTTSMALRQALDWNLFIGRSQGERDALTLLLGGTQINFALSAVRAGIANAFSGAGAQPQAARVAMFTAGARAVTRGEKIFAAGSGAAPSEAGIGPGTLVFEGLISPQDVLDARALP